MVCMYVRLDVACPKASPSSVPVCLRERKKTSIAGKENGAHLWHPAVTETEDEDRGVDRPCTYEHEGGRGTDMHA